MLMRQQDRLEGRVQNIDEQLTKLESNKTLMKVQYDTNIVYAYILNFCQHSPLSSCGGFCAVIFVCAVP